MGKATKLTEDEVQAIARVLADPRRFAIMQKIAASGNVACSCLRECQPISPATMSHHLKELADAGLIHVKHEGRTADIGFRRDVWEAYLGQLSKL